MRKVGVKEEPKDDNNHKDDVNNDRNCLRNSTA
jgi:hypothetical protein